jgi:hypothetical protein
MKAYGDARDRCASAQSSSCPQSFSRPAYGLMSCGRWCTSTRRPKDVQRGVVLHCAVRPPLLPAFVRVEQGEWRLH